MWRRLQTCRYSDSSWPTPRSTARRYARSAAVTSSTASPRLLKIVTSVSLRRRGLAVVREQLAELGDDVIRAEAPFLNPHHDVA